MTDLLVSAEQIPNCIRALHNIKCFFGIPSADKKTGTICYTASELFVLMDSDAQERIISASTDSELKEMLSELYLDDTVDIIEEMPANVVKRILKNCAPLALLNLIYKNFHHKFEQLQEM